METQEKKEQANFFAQKGGKIAMAVIALLVIFGIWHMVSGKDGRDDGRGNRKSAEQTQSGAPSKEMKKGAAVHEPGDAKNTDTKDMDAKGMNDTKAMGSDSAMKDQMKQSEMNGDTKSESAAEAAGSYEVYDASKLAKAKSGKVVLFFRASWCPSCKALDKDIREHLKDIPENVTILDVDYDKYSDLKKKYGVVMQHTLVQVDADGKEMQKWAGVPTLADLVNELNK